MNKTENALPHSELNVEAIIVLCLFVIIISLVLFATAYDYYFKQKGNRYNFLTAFSVLSNGKRIFKHSPKRTSSCLDGIRVISFFWVALFHHFSGYGNGLGGPSPSTNEWQLSWRSRNTIAGRNAVDTFFSVGGLLVSYNFVKSRENGENFNCIKFYMHRLVRLFPPLVALLGFTVYFSEHLVPETYLGEYEDKLVRICRKNWISTLLFFQNCLPDVSHLCLGNTWYLNVDLQLYLISPVLLWPMQKYPKIGTVVIVLLIICSMVSTFLAAWMNNLDLIYMTKSVEIFDNAYYYRTYTRASPWLIGLLCGCFISKIGQTKFTLQELRGVAFWTSSVAVIGFIVYYPAAVQGYNYKLQAAVYLTLSSPLWAIATCGVVVACICGCGGIINDFLSLPLFRFLIKFTYSWYLWHLLIVIIISSSTKTSCILSNITDIFNLGGGLVVSFLVAVIWIFLFELPPIALEKWWKNRNMVLPTSCDGGKQQNGDTVMPN